MNSGIINYSDKAVNNMDDKQVMRIENDSLMYKKTYDAYLAESERFIKRICSDHTELVSDFCTEAPKEFLVSLLPLLKEELLVAASQKSSGAWRKLRRAIDVYYRHCELFEQSKMIKSIKNPVEPGSRMKPPGRDKRLKNVPKADLEKVLENRLDAGDIESAGIIYICAEFGVRPCEVPYISYQVNHETNEITAEVVGAKKTAAGEEGLEAQRGLDRDLTVDYEELLHESLEIWSKLGKKDLERAQARIYRAGKKLWPRRKKRFCLYSLRYNKGSDLKKKNGSTAEGRAKTAAVMGHHTTTAQSAYGHANASTGGVVPKANPEAVNEVRRIPLSPPPWQPKPSKAPSI